MINLLKTMAKKKDGSNKSSLLKLITKTTLLFLLLFKPSVNFAYGLNEVLLVDTNRTLIINNDSLSIPALINKEVSLLKKNNNKIYFYSTSKNELTREYFAINPEALLIEKLGQIKLEIPNNKGKSKEVELLIGKRTFIFDINDLMLPNIIYQAKIEMLVFNWPYDFDLRNKILVYSEGMITMDYYYQNQVHKMKKSTAIAGGGLKIGKGFYYPTIVEGRYIIYIEGEEDTDLIYGKKKHLRSIKVYDILNKEDIGGEMKFYNVEKCYYNTKSMQLMILTKENSSNIYYQMYVYSFTTNKLKPYEAVLGACWL